MIDPRQSGDLARWRKAERERLLAARQALSPETRAAETAAMIADLERLIPGAGPQIVSVYWPIRAEPDLRAWMRSRAERGTRIALPVAIAHGQPLEFREWRPGVPLAHGLWRIPYPADGPAVTPTVVLAPMVGLDLAGYRLGYGGGFFDRTLAVLRPRPLVIGLGYAHATIPTIFPRPHDVPMDWVVTGALPARRRTVPPA